MRRTRKRRNGAGTIITRRAKGKVTGYTPEITVGWDDAGKREKVRGATYPTWDEANSALEELKRLHRHGMDLTDRQELAAFLHEWIESTFAPSNKPKSVTSYQWAERHISDEMGSTTLQRLTGQQIQRFITGLGRARGGRRKLAPKSIVLVHTVLHAALAQAKRWKLLPDNPADGIVLPRVERAPLKALTVAQAKAFLAAARGDPLEVALLLCLLLGLRRGEVAGLRCCDLDLVERRITINGTLTYIQGRGLVWGATKNNRARSLKLPASLAAALRWHLTRQEAQRKAMAGKWRARPADPAQDYVFVSPQSGGPLNSNQIYTAFKRVAQAAGLPEHLSPHSLRHSCASFLYADGVPDKAISVHLGHANTTITKEVYISLYQETLDDTAERVERLLGGADGDLLDGRPQRREDVAS